MLGCQIVHSTSVAAEWAHQPAERTLANSHPPFRSHRGWSSVSCFCSLPDHILKGSMKGYETCIVQMFYLFVEARKQSITIINLQPNAYYLDKMNERTNQTNIFHERKMIQTNKSCNRFVTIFRERYQIGLFVHFVQMV
jgi:hypothetical protein